jgi:hypothetical protein
MQAIVQVVVQTPEFQDACCRVLPRMRGTRTSTRQNARRAGGQHIVTIATTAPETRRDEQFPRSAHSMMSQVAPGKDLDIENQVRWPLTLTNGRGRV